MYEGNRKCQLRVLVNDWFVAPHTIIKRYVCILVRQAMWRTKEPILRLIGYFLLERKEGGGQRIKCDLKIKMALSFIHYEPFRNIHLWRTS